MQYELVDKASRPEGQVSAWDRAFPSTSSRRRGGILGFVSSMIGWGLITVTHLVDINDGFIRDNF